MTDFIWDNFGFLEAMLSLEIITLITAAFFYQIAKIIARADRHDPLVKFYRVFWLRFFTPVASIKDLDLQTAASIARDAGFVGLGEMDSSQLSNLDAPELTDVGDITVQKNVGRGALSESGAPTAKAIGRRGPEDEDRIAIARGDKETESREAKFIRKQKENPTVDAPIRMHNADQDKPEYRAATSIVEIRVMPGSSRDEIIGIAGGEVVIKLTTPPEDGKANGIIIDLLAARLGVRPYQISLLGGHYKLRKTVQVAGLDQATTNARLQQ